MTAQLAAGKAVTLTKRMNSSLGDSRPIDPDSKDRSLFVLGTSYDRARARAVDFDDYTALSETVGATIPLLRFEVRMAPFV